MLSGLTHTIALLLRLGTISVHCEVQMYNSLLKSAQTFLSLSGSISVEKVFSATLGFDSSKAKMYTNGWKV